MQQRTLDDRIPGLERAPLLGVLDDGERQPILHGGERVEKLALGVHVALRRVKLLADLHHGSCARRPIGRTGQSNAGGLTGREEGAGRDSRRWHALLPMVCVMSLYSVPRPGFLAPPNMFSADAGAAIASTSAHFVKIGAISLITADDY